MARPASRPCFPKTSIRALPTACELSGSSFNLADTSCTTSKVVLTPLVMSFVTCSELIPISSKAFAVAVPISLILALACLIASSPLSPKIPLLVCVNIATNCSTLSPASLKNAGYCCNLFRKSPLRSAPATSPSFTAWKAFSNDIPKFAATLSIACKVGLKSRLNVSATAITSLRKAFMSSPAIPVNSLVNLVASCNPTL